MAVRGALGLGLVFVVVALAAPPRASALAVYFGTPGNAAYCGMGPDSPHRYNQEFVTCYTPNDGFTVIMNRYGRPSKSYNRYLRGQYLKPYRRLRFGHTWRWHGFKCVSRRSGLTCRNRGGHGWWLGRFVGYRLF